MEFDLLVRKYLRGTLSPSELERLRDLLERVPEYRTELRQILELRSIIHDDALRLIPPRELSDRTRERVGAQFVGIESLLRDDASRLATPGDLSDSTRMAVGQLFAASAPGVSPGALPGASGQSSAPDDEESKKRRAVILPYRIAGRMMLAASIAITVALAPSLLGPSADGDASRNAERLAAGSGATESLSGAASTEAPARGSVNSAAATVETMPGVGGITPLAAASASTTSSATASRTLSLDRVTNAAASAAPTTARDGDAATAPAADLAAATTVESSDAGALASEVPIDFESVHVDPDNPLTRVIRGSLALGGSRTYNPAIDSSMLERAEPFAALALGTIAIPGIAPDGRRLSVGVTLGSGNVMDADAPAALMQNSYYFSFSVSGTDRIGVEMGGSTFLQETLVPEKRTGSGGFAKEGAGDTSGATTLLPGNAPRAMVAQRVKQDITYGGVFYDRRIELERAWDVCGRVTFGAADGALVAGLRAYTAFSPTKNVTLTLGIGGSTLVDLKGRRDDGSTNYGLYYGIETGF